eukprot:TRINITY_DN5471_c0_g1_i2.p1 TRINITY_DN5471_c0_g1~~TRINITY_DN5471_c0_g1_i2.p1  ORF type:complete len:467 (-),score=44.30 TRINITY_DN5471_c0_g1_i2:27-1427(-)
MISKLSKCSLRKNIRGLIERIGQPHPSTHPHLLNPNEITVGITRNEYLDRRKKLVSMVPDNSTILMVSAKHCYMAHDIPYRYRPDTDFYYLTGFQEPNSAFLIEKTNDNKYSTTLFVPPRDKHSELWHGPRTGASRAPECFAVDNAYPIDELGRVLKGTVSKVTASNFFYKSVQTEDSIINSLEPLSKKPIYAINQHIEQMRLIKSPAEIEMMKKAGKLSAEAFKTVIKKTKSFKVEGDLEAAMEYYSRINGGALRLAYPPVVANGVSNNTLHYINNDDILRNGDMILMDAGAEYHHFNADITRTWPYNGRFSEPQKIVYNALLDVQLKCIEKCNTSKYGEVSIEEIHAYCVELIKEAILRIGLVKSSSEARKKLTQFFPHSIGHWLGMDLHDIPTVSTSTPLKPGMILTIEPGIYISHEDTTVPEEFRGIGIRIEDDILVTDSEPFVLTKDVPKEVDELEELINS